MDQRPGSANPGTANPTNPSLTPGVRVLIKGANGEVSTSTKLTSAAAAALPAIRLLDRSVLVTLVMSDVLLCALAYHVVRSATGPVGFLSWTLCLTAIALGAWQSYLAVKAVAGRRATGN